MSTVLILEDEKWTLEFLEFFVSNHPMVERVFAVNNAQDAIGAARQNLPDIALLDIELQPPDKLNGIQTARMIASLSPATELVFVTGYGKYALDSFVVHPYDYVLKPIQKDKLTDIITELSIKAGKTKNKMAIKTTDGITIFKLDQIFFIEKEGRYSTIHSQQGSFYTLLTITNLEMMLPAQFIKTHNAYIVNITKILTIKSTDSRNYEVCFSGYEKTALVSRGGFKKNKYLFTSLLA